MWFHRFQLAYFKVQAPLLLGTHFLLCLKVKHADHAARSKFGYLLEGKQVRSDLALTILCLASAALYAIDQASGWIGASLTLSEGICSIHAVSDCHIEAKISHSHFHADQRNFAALAGLAWPWNSEFGDSAVSDAIPVPAHG